MAEPSDSPTVLLSIETGSRELESKLVIASALAKQGYRAIVAHKEAAHEIARVSHGIVWLGKSIFSPSGEHLADRLIANGSAMVYLAEEGGIYSSDSWAALVLRKNMTDHFRREHLGRICVWGSRQRDLIATRHPDLADAIAVTGAPRFDLCREAFAWVSRGEATSRGPYLLLNTRFSSVAHAKGAGAPFVSELNTKEWPEGMSRDEIADLWFARWRQEAHDWADFVVLAHALTRLEPNIPIVIRPHPSESIDFYRSAFPSGTNVEVIRKGDVLDWIRGASAVVHSNCTSGLEAVLAGRPSVNFLPPAAQGTRLDVEVASESGTVVRSVAEAQDQVRAVLRGAAKEHTWSERARSILNNLNEDAIPLVVREVVAVAREAGLNSSRVELPRGDTARGKFGKALRGALGKDGTDDYVASKRGTMPRDRVESIVEGCTSRGIGSGHVRLATPHYTVIDPL